MPIKIPFYEENVTAVSQKNSEEFPEGIRSEIPSTVFGEISGEIPQSIPGKSSGMIPVGDPEEISGIFSTINNSAGPSRSSLEHTKRSS